MKPWIKQIRELMKQRGMTQEALACQLGKGQSWLNHKLSGRRKANVEDIVMIARALDIEPSTLLNNVTNYDRLADNFLGVAEPETAYLVDQLDELKHRLQQLDPDKAQEFLQKTLVSLDQAISQSRSKKPRS